MSVKRQNLFFFNVDFNKKVSEEILQGITVKALKALPNI